jgi:hypothetical protein
MKWMFIDFVFLYWFAHRAHIPRIHVSPEPGTLRRQTRRPRFLPPRFNPHRVFLTHLPRRILFLTLFVDRQIPMHVRMETSTTRYFPPHGMVPGLWTTRLKNDKIGYWEFTPTDGAVRRIVWGREMDGVPVYDKGPGGLSGKEGDQGLGGLRNRDRGYFC